MENQTLNTSYIQQYAKDYAQKVCDVFFRTSQFIDGRQVLNLANVQQVNLFVVKSLYEAWQKEASEFDSPYYDYNNPEVKQLLKQLMNVLSKHIKVERENFEPLFQKAVADTLIFTLSPKTYFKSFFEGFEGKIHVGKQLSPLVKYYKVHTEFMKALVQKLQQEDIKIKPSKANKIAEELLNTGKVALSDPMQVTNEMSTFLQLSQDELFTTAAPSSSAEPESTPAAPTDASELFTDKQEGEGQSAGDIFKYEDFGSPTEPTEKTSEPEKPKAGQKQQQETQKTEEKDFYPPLPDSDDMTEDPATQVGTDIDNVNIEGIEEQPSTTRTSTPFSEEEELKDPGSLFKRMEQEHQEQLGGQQNGQDDEALSEESMDMADQEPPAEQPPKKPLIPASSQDEDDEDLSIPENSTYSKLISNMNKGESLRNKIPLNLRFKFQNELFDGDDKLYEDAINSIDGCNTYKEAMDMVKERYLKKLNWDISESSTIEFLNLIDQKF